MKKALPAILCLLCLSLCVKLYAQAPVITSLTPATGVVGSTVTITGSNFNSIAANNVVYFGATRATVTTTTATQLKVTVPAGASNMPVTVVNTPAKLQGSSRNAFIPTFDPNVSKNLIPSQFINPDPSFTEDCRSVTITDIDGDGKPDLLYVNPYTSKLVILRNTGNPGSLTEATFAQKVEFSTLSNPVQIVINDINNDGKPDVAVLSQFNNRVSVYPNTSTSGSITMGTRVDAPTGVNPQYLAVGDVDNDGLPDLVVCNGQTVNSSSQLVDGSVYVIKNTTSGTFAPSFATRVSFGFPHAGTFKSQVKLSDIDGDGKQDMLVMAYNSTDTTAVSNVSVYKNTSTPGVINSTSFSNTGPNFDVAFGARDFAVADVNGDNKPDIIINGKHSNTLLLNAATAGSISAASFSSSTAPVIHNQGIFQMADVNGDGKPDLVNFTDSLSSLNIFLNNAKAGQPATINSFTPSVRAEALTDTLDNIAIGDIDGDGRPDFVTATPRTEYDGFLTFIRNAPVPPVVFTSFSPLNGPVGTTVTINGSGFSTAPERNIVYFGATQAVVSAATATQLTVAVPYGASYQPISVLNLDTRFTASAASPFNITFAATALTLAPKFDLPTGTQASAVATGDIDGDGKPDLVVANTQANTISIYRNKAFKGNLNAASFTIKTDLSTSTGPTAIQLADIDNDGKLDIIVTATTPNRVCIFRNTSAGNGGATVSFAPRVLLLTQADPNAIAIADFDADGRPDIAVSNADSTVSILRNASLSGVITADSFQPQMLIRVGNAPRGIAAADINNDGRPDLVVTNSGSNSISLLYNNTSPGVLGIKFAAKVDFATGTNPQGIAVGDLNNDGRPDIAVANKGDNTVSILRNTTSAGGTPSLSFAAKVDFTTGAQPQGVTIADLNGNNKPEVIVTNSAAATAAVMLNHSSGTTIDLLRYTVATGVTPTGLSADDLDGDGRPDLVVANSGSGNISILRNSSPPQDNPAATMPPVITSLSATSGDVGSHIIITGQNFNLTPAKNIVLFGHVRAVVNNSTTTSLDVTVPIGSLYENITVINDDNFFKTQSYLPFTTTFASKNSITAADFDPRVDLSIYYYHPQLVDIDGDGKLDLTANQNMYRNNAVSGNISTSSSFDQSSSYPFYAYGYDLKYDINNDGKFDQILAVLNNTKSDSAFKFTNNQLNIAINSQSQVQEADIDGDGKTDILTTPDYSYNDPGLYVQVHLNTSDGRNLRANSFSAQSKFLVLNSSGGDNGVPVLLEKLVDVDGDGRPELIIITDKTGTETPKILICHNTSTVGHPAFAAPLILNTDTKTSELVTGDIDGDGKTDLLITNSGGGGFYALRNTYTPGQTPWNPFPSATLINQASGKFAGAALNDIDGDGKPDLIVNRIDSTEHLDIYRNIATTGSAITAASFAAPVELASGGPIPSNDVAVGDVDGDGKPDIVTHQPGNTKVAIFRNNPVTPPGLLAAKQDTVMTSKKALLQLNTNNHLVIHQAISPNGDGVNDFFTIDDIDKYADNKVTIINTNGDKVFETAGYNNSTNVFNGHSTTGIKQQAGTYYYILEYMNKGKKQVKTGYLVLKY